MSRLKSAINSYSTANCPSAANANCKILETEIAVVEVKYSLIEALIEARTVFEGAIILFKPVEETVPEELEKYREPPGLKQGDKCKIIQVIDHPATLKKNFKICQLELLSPNSGK
ncbi:MAG: UPF0179 family protein [Candidatus Odinarchaeota archaeon]